MNGEIEKLKIERNESKKKSAELYYLTEQIEYFLRYYVDLFKKNDSVKALEMIREFKEIKKKELRKIYEYLMELDNKLGQICQHQILVHFGGGNWWCPICESELGLSGIQKQLTTKYFVESEFNDNKKIKSMITEIVDAAMESENDLIEEIEAGLEEIQYNDKVKVLRRWH